MKRIRIEEFFTDFDKLRKGKVSKHQFESILSMLNFKTTKEECDFLFNKYKTSDAERMFNYYDFIANINSAFTTTGIQKDPLAKVAPVTVDNTTLARKKYLEITESERQQLSEILKQYA